MNKEVKKILEQIEVLSVQSFNKNLIINIKKILRPIVIFI